MSNYNFKFDLSKLSGFGKITLTGKSGQPKRCIVIPIEENHIFEGDKGTYLDIAFIETSNSQYGDTHFATRSKSKEEQEQEKKSGERLKLPILGNLKPFGGNSATNNGDDDYSVYTGAATPKKQDITTPIQKGELDDQLPF